MLPSKFTDGARTIIKSEQKYLQHIYRDLHKKLQAFTPKLAKW